MVDSSPREKARLETQNQEMETSSVHLLLVGTSCQMEEVNKRVWALFGLRVGRRAYLFFCVRQKGERKGERQEACVRACVCTRPMFCLWFECPDCSLIWSTWKWCVCVHVCVSVRNTSENARKEQSVCGLNNTLGDSRPSCSSAHSMAKLAG